MLLRRRVWWAGCLLKRMGLLGWGCRGRRLKSKEVGSRKGRVRMIMLVVMHLLLRESDAMLVPLHGRLRVYGCGRRVVVVIVVY
jgi:hypothetical protein